MAETKTSTSDQITEMRKRRARAVDVASKLYDLASDDIKFVVVPGSQWDEGLKQRRGDRPCYEFPKLAPHTRQVINEMRQTRPQGKVRGAEESDRGLAEIMQGLCRNIESVSNAEQAYDIAYETAVQGGFGVFRICTDYRNDDDFDQDIFIRPIRNWQAVKFDPAAVEIDRRDGMFAFVDETRPDDEAKREFPDADWDSFFDDVDCKRDWQDAGKVRISEYFYKVPVKRELWALSSGETVDGSKYNEAQLAASGITIERRRTVNAHKVMSVLTNGYEFLTEPHEIPSKFIPLVPVWGNIQTIDGEDYWQGMVRPSKDQQRLHNVHRTAAIEAVAKAPKAPFILKMKWIKGFTQFWQRANSEDYPYLPLADDAPDNAMPQRAKQAEVPQALLHLAALETDDMKSATGQHDASLGARSNETSGKAINARKMQGATATFNYIDNLTYAIRFTYEILVDMIPKVYDTPRVVRVLGADGGEKWKKLYQQVPDPQNPGQFITLNDISKGKYDVVVTVGPTYATQRLEAVDAFTNMLGQMGNGLPPQIAALMAYTAVKNMDVPGVEDVDAAFRKMLVGQGMLQPKDGEQPPAPPQPNPVEIAEGRLKVAQADKAGSDARKADAEAAQTELETTLMAQVAGYDAAINGAPPPVPMGAPPGPPPAAMTPPQGGVSF